VAACRLIFFLPIRRSMQLTATAMEHAQLFATDARSLQRDVSWLRDEHQISS
jgi:hypothetical protein